LPTHSGWFKQLGRIVSIMEKNNTPDQPEKSRDVEEAPHTTPTAKPRAKSRNITINSTALIAYGATAVIALLVGTGLGFVLGKNTRVDDASNGMMRLSPTNSTDDMRQNSFSPRGYSQSEQTSRLTGVVTAVNGSVLTVAGGGNTYTVTTDSSTQWAGSSSATVKDTVIIEFSGSGNDLTALSIRVIGASSTSNNDSSQSTSANNT